MDEQIQEILAGDNFGHTQERTRWVPRSSEEEDDDSFLPTLKLDGLLGQWFGAFSEIILWVALFVLLVTGFRMRDRWLPWLRGASAGPSNRNAQRGGLLLTEEELPTDVPTVFQRPGDRRQSQPAGAVHGDTVQAPLDQAIHRLESSTRQLRPPPSSRPIAG